MAFTYSPLTGADRGFLKAIVVEGSTNMSRELFTLFILALPIASIAWTVTHEEVFREPRDYCKDRSEKCDKLLQRKFFYLFTCEYCFSHYVAAFFLLVTRFKLLFPDWRGYLISGFALVWVANLYMSIFARVRLDVKRERVEIAAQEKALEHH
ncbi:MAG TPA: hypothetical protein VE641_05335 [Chthoniobacterales bacterium]|nr:hypothetical protein [Chthoniobacterales bacterium]